MTNATTKTLDLANLPQNKAGGLNLMWAVRQALEKLGVDTKIAQVRTFIETQYGPMGKKAVLNSGSLSTAIGTQRSKLRQEQTKAPPVPKDVVKPVDCEVVPAVLTVKKAEVVTKPEVKPPSFEELGVFVKEKLTPALQLVEEVEEVEKLSDRASLFLAFGVVDDAVKALGDRDRVKAVVAVFAAT